MPLHPDRSRAHKVPCALKDYLSKSASHDAFTKLSARESQMAFQNWVAYGRTGTSDSKTREHLTCPLLWCRHTFEDLESCLQHVSTCQWLSNAWYWCHRCRQAELFTPEESSLSSPCPHTVGRKVSKLRRAVSFFKHIGDRSRSQRRESGDHTYSWNHEDMATEPDKDSFDLEKESVDEVEESTPALDLSLFDEDFQMPIDQEKREVASEVVLRPSTLYDMEANALSPLRDFGNDRGGTCTEAVELATSDLLFSSVQLEDTILPELPGSHHDIHASTCTPRSRPPSHYGPFSLSLYMHETEGMVSPIPADYQDAIDNRIMSLTSPISPLDAPNSRQSIGSNGYSANVDLDPSPRVKSLLTADPADHDLHMESRSGKPLVEDSLPETRSERLVQELDILVCGLHSNWAQQLPIRKGKQPCNRLLDPRFCGLSPFEAGLRALQQCFQGTAPVTYEGVLSIMQLAYASAYLIDGSRHSWHALFDDVLRWQDLIKNEEDRALYVMTVTSLWDPKVDYGQLSQTHDVNESKIRGQPAASIQDLGGMDLDDENIPGSLESPSYFTPESRLSSAMTLSESTWSTAFRHGDVIGACSEFLDAIEYVNIKSGRRAASRLSLASIQLSANKHIIKASVIEPLLQWHGIDGFRRGLLETQDEILHGTLHNIREVEVVLIAEAKKSLQPVAVEQAYLTLVSTLCDTAMQHADSTWRDRYYAAYIDGVLAISLEQHNQQLRSSRARARRPAPINTALANTGQAKPVPQAALAGLPSSKSSASFNLRDSFPSSATSSTCETPTIAAWSQTTSANNSNWTTPQVSPEKPIFTIPPAEQPTSSNPTSPTSPSHVSTKTSLCPTCNAAFSGNLQYRTSNLRRHERTVHRRLSKLLCPEPGCGVECGRSDNLRKHRRTAHGIEEPVRRHVRGKRRRGSEDAEITTWI